MQLQKTVWFFKWLKKRRNLTTQNTNTTNPQLSINVSSLEMHVLLKSGSLEAPQTLDVVGTNDFVSLSFWRCPRYCFYILNVHNFVKEVTFTILYWIAMSRTCVALHRTCNWHDFVLPTTSSIRRISANLHSLQREASYKYCKSRFTDPQ